MYSTTVVGKKGAKPKVDKTEERMSSLLATQVTLIDRITQIFAAGPKKVKLLGKWMEVLSYNIDCIKAVNDCEEE